MAIPKPKRIPTDVDQKRQALTAEQRRHWLAKWKQELQDIRNDSVEWQKELHDRELTLGIE